MSTYKYLPRSKAKDTRRLSKSMIDITDGISVTKYVERRLRKRAQREPGPKIVRLLSSVIPITIFISGMILYCRFIDSGRKYSEGSLAILMFGGVLMAGFGSVGFLLDVEERLVTKRITVLAKTRSENIEERRLFYGSPEWRLLREQIIAEQGRLCRQCGQHIIRDFDLTVDHIRPRSKFPELALDKSNLQILCRQCNSSKGNTTFDS